MRTVKLSIILAGSVSVFSACGGGQSTATTTSTSTQGESSGSDTGETGGENLCGGWSLTVTLEGSEVGPGSCDDFIFTGSTTDALGPGHWSLDSCGCDEDCAEADPYELTLEFSSEPGFELPALPACPQIEIYRDDACWPRVVVVRDLGAESATTWWAAGRDESPAGWFTTQLDGEQLCSDGDDDGPVVTGHAVIYSTGDASVELLPAQSGTLASSPLGPLTVHNGNGDSITFDEPYTLLSHMVVVD